MGDLIVENVNNENFKGLGEIIKIPIEGEREPTLKS